MVAGSIPARPTNRINNLRELSQPAWSFMSALCGHGRPPLTASTGTCQVGAPAQGPAPPSSSSVTLTVRAYAAASPGCPATVPVAVTCWSRPYTSSTAVIVTVPALCVCPGRNLQLPVRTQREALRVRGDGRGRDRHRFARRRAEDGADRARAVVLSDPARGRHERHGHRPRLGPLPEPSPSPCSGPRSRPPTPAMSERPRVRVADATLARPAAQTCSRETIREQSMSHPDGSLHDPVNVALSPRGLPAVLLDGGRTHVRDVDGQLHR